MMFPVASTQKPLNREPTPAQMKKVWNLLADYVEAPNANALALSKAWQIVAYNYTVPQAAVPDGYVMVPVEPTKAMIEAGIAERQKNRSNMNPWHVYKAMLTASKDGQS